jgi:hypothetical protein
MKIAMKERLLFLPILGTNTFLKRSFRVDSRIAFHWNVT